jgi:hypothetical protein
MMSDLRPDTGVDRIYVVGVVVVTAFSVLLATGQAIDGRLLAAGALVFWGGMFGGVCLHLYVWEMHRRGDKDD